MIDSGAELSRNLERVRARIAAAADRAGRDAGEVLLVAVAKRQPAAAVELAARAGVRDIGENYVNELAAKRETVDAEGLRWHFVGALQSSTAHRVADLADVVHSVGSVHAAERLAARAERDGRTIGSLVQVDFTGAGGRNGVAPEETAEAVHRLRGLAGIEVRGLMTMPPFDPDPEASRAWFRRLRELRDAARAGPGDLPELSMGMSGDYEVAVEEGATMVRIGTALFGSRPTE
ncbi:MAG TPA: YggS family pyridoxal phosphate-dependent enzyme [Actinomycetota bacterium]|nr:YggS family pyridoxal phosphate-dependent enzyme [Actinomycetota bacterium]